jgi:putative MATE family efflux protein
MICRLRYNTASLPHLEIRVKDLTQGPIRGHLLAMAAPMAIGMLVQTLFFFVDLYFVSKLGSDAVAGVSTAGNATFIVMALTQMLSVATVTLISHAAGKKDHKRVNLVFNQAFFISLLGTLATLLLGSVLVGRYMQQVAANPQIAALGASYLHWFLPGLALQFVMMMLGAALRGVGVTKPPMVAQLVSISLNIVLAPILIAGWGTGHAMGVAGAGLASSIALVVAVALLLWHFRHHESYLDLHREKMRPVWPVWREMLKVGLPAGGEFLLMFCFIAFVYSVLRDFGGAAQAGFGIGSRVMQMLFLPAMAVGFAVPAVAGQNFGAGHAERVRATLFNAILIETGLMLILTVLCKINPHWLASPFSDDPAVLAYSSEFLTIISWNFVASGLLFACSGMFQALGNTWPGLLCSALRLTIFMLPVSWLARQSGFHTTQVWYLSVATMLVQAACALGLVFWQMRLRLPHARKVHAEVQA